MAFALLFSLLPSWIKALFIVPKPREQVLIQLADRTNTTHQTRKYNPPSSFFHYENERMLHAANQTSTSIRCAKPELKTRTRTPESPFSQGDIHNEPDRQYGPPNSVMSQETESQAFVKRLNLLEERIAESEKIGSFMSHDLKRTQFEILELRKALQASNKMIKQLQQMLGDVVLTRQSTTATSYAEDQIHHPEVLSQQVDDQAYQNPYRLLVKNNGMTSSPRPVLASMAGFPPPTPLEFQERNWPTLQWSEKVDVFIPTSIPVDEIMPSVTQENPCRLVKNNGMTSSPRPVLASMAGFPPPTPLEFQERNWPTLQWSEKVDVFIPTSMHVDEILLSITMENPYRLVKNNGMTSSPRPVLASISGFPPPTPLEFQERNWPTLQWSEKVDVFIPTSMHVDEILLSITMENPYRLVKNNGMTSSPRPVLASISGFPPPTPLEFQERNWPTLQWSEKVDVFIPTSIPVDEIKPSVTQENPYRLVKNNGMTSSPRPVLASISGFPPPTPLEFQERNWPTLQWSEKVDVFIPTSMHVDEILLSITMENPYRLVKNNGMTSSPRPVLASISGFPPPTPLEFQERNWPTLHWSEKVDVFIPTSMHVDEILLSITMENPYRLVKNNGMTSSPRPVLASISEFPPPTPLEFQERNWPTLQWSEKVDVFIPTSIPVDEIMPSVTQENPYRLVKNNGMTSSPRPVLASMAGFPPPTPLEFQERNWPTLHWSEKVDVFIPTSMHVDEILLSITMENPYRLVKNNGMTSSPRPVLASISGFPPPTPLEFQERNWPTLQWSEKVDVFIPTSIPVDEIMPSVTQENPYRLVKNNGMTSSPRPVLASMAGFPPPTPLEFQERNWPTLQWFEKVKIFTPTLENPIPFSLTLDESYVDKNEIQVTLKFPSTIRNEDQDTPNITFMVSYFHQLNMTL
ncbi:hypothetical protein GHT06_012379 [Daphnia sinensis]|uniref:Uncharacterized protein n=1 Tax=Daphnia sinensis TaxID=1820382 RepID=A0AAD5PW37_9CRUS|nr:hypothetical protein GHT06_012379 [Daphnia sinensis]